jgi:hypothetical protein
MPGVTRKVLVLSSTMHLCNDGLGGALVTIDVVAEAGLQYWYYVIPKFEFGGGVRSIAPIID